jgi:hypothetical protein
MLKLYIGREPCPPTKAYLDPNSLVVCYAGRVSTTASPQPLRPGAAGEVFSSMYSCYFLLLISWLMCTQADHKLDLLVIIEKERDNGIVYSMCHNDHRV